MKNKKGFTLVELLAVIVILSIIMLIAIPVILNTMNTAKKKGFEDYAYRVASKAEEKYVLEDEDDPKTDDVVYDLKDLGLTNIGNYKGFVLFKKIGDKVKKFVTLYNDDYALVDYNMTDGVNDEGKSVSIVDAIKKVTTIAKEELTKEYLVENANKSNGGNKDNNQVNTNVLLTGYQGRLHVCGTNLCNESNQPVRIKGVSTGGVGGEKQYDNPQYGRINDESIQSVKRWGANGIRYFITANQKWMASYIGHEDAYINALKKMIDVAVRNDMYVIINWDPADNKRADGSGDPLTSKAIEAFQKVANSYPNDPHILYELWNEPQVQNTWDDVKNHTAQVLPAIRSISKDAVIFIGSPDANKNLAIPASDPLNYTNIMYSHHMYMRSMTNQTTEGFKKAIAAKIPIFITEWGPEGEGHDTPQVTLPHTYRYTNLIEQYKLSYMFFGFGASTFNGGDRYGITNTQGWNNNLDKATLTSAGEILKNQLREKVYDVKDSMLMVK